MGHPGKVNVIRSTNIIMDNTHSQQRRKGERL